MTVLKTNLRMVASRWARAALIGLLAASVTPACGGESNVGDGGDATVLGDAADGGTLTVDLVTLDGANDTQTTSDAAGDDLEADLVDTDLVTDAVTSDSAQGEDVGEDLAQGDVLGEDVAVDSGIDSAIDSGPDMPLTDAGGDAPIDLGTVDTTEDLADTGPAPDLPTDLTVMQCLGEVDPCPENYNCFCGGPGPSTNCFCGVECESEKDCEGTDRPVCCGNTCTTSCECFCD